MTNCALRLSDQDDVAVMIEAAPRGSQVLGITACDDIPASHKIAVRSVSAGSALRKYGQVIGIATRDIAVGDHVHSHNLAVGDHRARDDQFATITELTLAGQGEQAFFDGYVRESGGVGTRNVIGIIASANCSATVVRRIARQFEDGLPQGIDAVAPFTHASGRGIARSGEGFETLERTLTGYARNPNFGGILFVGLGYEVAQIDDMLARHGLAPGLRLRTLTIQDAGGTAEAIKHGTTIVVELIQQASGDRRTRRSVADLVLGLQCGGGGWLVGGHRKPGAGHGHRSVGRGWRHGVPVRNARDLWCLTFAAGSRGQPGGGRSRIAWWEGYAARHGASLDNNPSPGNKAGGLTTIFEKSLGAIAKAGSSPLSDLLLYAEQRRTNGLIFMDSPGYDPCSATGQIASGANLLAFTTGRCSVFGAQPTPCLKLASNAARARAMARDIDIDCSLVLEGTSVAQAGAMIFAAMLATASGKPTRSEALGVGDFEFVPWQLGAWM